MVAPRETLEGYAVYRHEIDLVVGTVNLSDLVARVDHLVAEIPCNSWPRSACWSERFDT